jgi:tetratricopeptide (TPR) repeat protein
MEAKFYHVAGSHFLNSKLDPTQAMQFYQRALELSRMCGDVDQQCGVLILIAWLYWRDGDHSSGRVHAIEAQRLSELAANLYQEARAHWAGAACSIYFGNYWESITQFHRAREVINICDLTGGDLSHESTLVQAEIHLLKSEYAQARNIYTQIIKTTSPDQNAFAYALSLLNIAHIDISI